MTEPSAEDVTAAFSAVERNEAASMAKDAEKELDRCASLVCEIESLRLSGIVETNLGSDDDDLLGAIDALDDAIVEWRKHMLKASGGNVQYIIGRRPVRP